MSNDEKWLDELLDRTEKEEILDSLKRALQYLDELETKKAYNILELLYESLGGDYDTGKYVEEYEINIEKVPVVPRAWSTGGTPSPQQHHHQVNHGDLNEMHYAHDHTDHVSLSNLDEELENMTASAVEQALAEINQRMEERDKDLLEMVRVWEGYAERAEKHMHQIEVDQHLFEKITGVTAPPPPEDDSISREDLEVLIGRTLIRHEQIGNE